MSSVPPLTRINGVVSTTLDLRVYRLAAVKKASYRVADRCTVTMAPPEGDTLPITILFRPSVDDASAAASVRAFFQELLDQELREHIAEETAPMRTLILAQAFSKTNLIVGR